LDVLSKTDSLTGAINRRAFDDLLLKHYENRHEEKCFVMMLDIDNFKTINDNFGHQAGDDYLKAFVSSLKTAVRESDLVSRLGGEEFCVILSNLNQDKVLQIAERMCSLIQALSISSNCKKITTTVSIGISEIDIGDQSKKEVLARADAALYEAKREGKNRYKLF
ncbi:MAG TPA: GGDEF domain-containing protein, partial [Methylotenera sp.]|nr:GGDEF domain-containing protein [Methylotenera sp.]